MSETHRIETLGHFSTYGDSTKGDYLCTVAGDTRELKLFHDTSSDYAAPKVGDEFPAEIVQGKRGEWRLKRASRGGSSSTGGGSTQARQSEGPGLTWRSAPYERGAEHPRNEVRMIHTSALSAAVPYINQMLAFGVVDAPKDEDAYWKLVGRVAARLRDSYQGPLGRVGASQGAPQAALSNGGEVPADTRELAPAASAGNDDDIPF